MCAHAYILGWIYNCLRFFLSRQQFRWLANIPAKASLNKTAARKLLKFRARVSCAPTKHTHITHHIRSHTENVCENINKIVDSVWPFCLSFRLYFRFCLNYRIFSFVLPRIRRYSGMFDATELVMALFERKKKCFFLSFVCRSIAHWTIQIVGPNELI